MSHFQHGSPLQRPYREPFIWLSTIKHMKNTQRRGCFYDRLWLCCVILLERARKAIFSGLCGLFWNVTLWSSFPWWQCRCKNVLVPHCLYPRKLSVWHHMPVTSHDPLVFRLGHCYWHIMITSCYLHFKLIYVLGGIFSVYRGYCFNRDSS